MVRLAASGNFLIAPNAAVLIYPLIALAMLVCGVVTATKGRWGWLLAGFLTAGICWVFGAFQSPLPGSAWVRFAAARHAKA